jgi:hypothetical protein
MDLNHARLPVPPGAGTIKFPECVTWSDRLDSTSGPQSPDKLRTV